MSLVRGWGPERHFFILPPAQLKETIRGKNDRATKAWKMDFGLVMGKQKTSCLGGNSGQVTLPFPSLSFVFLAFVYGVLASSLPAGCKATSRA